MQRLALGTALIIILLVIVLFATLFWSAWNAAGDLPQDGAAPSAAEIDAAFPADRGAVAVAPSGLAIPVAGMRPAQLLDTYSQARAGGARVHDAIDIMAPRGTAVVAAADGLVERLFFSRGGGGITVYVRSPDRRWSYYYAHLEAYAPGLREGQRIRRGDPIGTVGSTGNANPAGPHLHFAIRRMGPTDRWHQGIPINPYPLLAGGGAPR
ncbi:MAG: M23 family metallopeptidase [Sphingosinicella sp.]|uniref:M23 family metallopeptidase n=1 Tax=Sphingosinicella sp. TaxID=1917971 RepID=UPI004037D5E0